MANISYRLGKKCSPGEIENIIRENEEIVDSFDRMMAHLNANEIDLTETLATMGSVLATDTSIERFVRENRKEANMLYKRDYREPFVIRSGDLNGDGAVNMTDIAVLSESWLKSEPFSTQCGDLDEDGNVNMIDLVFLAEDRLRQRLLE
jgi:hypothetical protein